MRTQSTTSDPVEFARGHLAAFSFLSSTSAREVHVQSIRRAFDKAGIGGTLRFAMRVLLLMREAEDLGNGYWFPTPLRAVNGDGLTLLVSPSPTLELTRHFPSLRRAGYARVLSREDAKDLPRQALDDWLGSAPMSTKAWAESEVASARAAFGPTLPCSNLEFFCVLPSGTRASPIFSPHWTQDPTRAITDRDGIVFCRNRLSDAAFRYFIGRLDSNQLVAESNLKVDVDRLQFGFALAARQNITVVAMRLTDCDIFMLPANLPRPERRLLFALGCRDPRYAGRAYRVPNGSASSLVSARLVSLGAEVRWEK